MAHDFSPAVTAEADSQQPSRLASLWPGLLLSSVIALIAWQLGRWLPLVGGPVFGIVLGVVVRNVVAPPVACQPGIRFAGKQILQWSIVALGLGLSLAQVAQTGLSSLSVTLVTVAAAFVAAWLLGRALGIPSKLKLLIGVGTAICGGSAIAAATPIIKADEHDTAFA
ncbi:MAG TPA: putative sulfate exporter family transporter, partial [Rhodanobacteraceae bacterium]|nr:putative sulfate exporter family transporter [Rhodanobacteraceae bacterium]